MLGKSLGLPVLTFESSSHYHISPLDIVASAPNATLLRLKASRVITQSFQLRTTWLPVTAWKNWKVCSTAPSPSETTSFNDGETEMWEACREALTAFEFTNEEKDKILGKAFGHVHSPYWGEEREKRVPRQDIINGILDYLRELGLSDDELGKLLKKFPEVLGCSLDEELKKNVVVLADTWGIKDKSLRSLLLRNPKVLGYNVDCKGDCIAQCTRCWVRF